MHRPSPSAYRGALWLLGCILWVLLLRGPAKCTTGACGLAWRSVRKQLAQVVSGGVLPSRLPAQQLPSVGWHSWVLFRQALQLESNVFSVSCMPALDITKRKGCRDRSHCCECNPRERCLYTMHFELCLFCPPAIERHEAHPGSPRQPTLVQLCFRSGPARLECGLQQRAGGSSC